MRGISSLMLYCGRVIRNMPDLPDRQAREAKLARTVGKLLTRQQREVIVLLGDPPDIDNIPAEYWQEQSAAFRTALQPHLEEIAAVSAEQMAGSTPVGVEPVDVSTAISEGLRDHVTQLTTGITNTTRNGIARKLLALAEAVLALPIVARALRPIFGPSRAELIAVTETTRAAVQGEQIIIDKLSEQGQRFIDVWHTANDERVCPICEPLHGVKRNEQGSFGDGYTSPPAHPRCRCWIDRESI